MVVDLTGKSDEAFHSPPPVLEQIQHESFIIIMCTQFQLSQIVAKGPLVQFALWLLQPKALKFCLHSTAKGPHVQFTVRSLQPNQALEVLFLLRSLQPKAFTLRSLQPKAKVTTAKGQFTLRSLQPISVCSTYDARHCVLTHLGIQKNNALTITQQSIHTCTNQQPD